MLYPLSDTGEPLSPRLTRRLRQHFQAVNTWSSLRGGVAGLPPAAPAILPGLTPQVAGWLDDGAFARWVLSRVSDVPSTLEWLCSHLDQGLANQLSIALGDVCDPSRRRHDATTRAPRNKAGPGCHGPGGRDPPQGAPYAGRS